MTATYRDNIRHQTEPYVAAFKEFGPAIAHKNPPWISQLRKSAMRHFAEIGFPSTDLEEWKYTNVSPLMEMAFKPASLEPATIEFDQVQPHTFGLPGSRLVFVNGRFSAEFSDLPERHGSAHMGSLLAAMEHFPREVERHLGASARFDNNPFTSINTAFFSDGAFVTLPPKEVLDQPILILFVSLAANAGATTHPRNLIIADERSHGTIIEAYVSLGESPCFTNPVTEIVVGRHATVEHLKIQMECADCFHIAAVEARQEQDSRFISHSVSVGARLVRNEIHSLMDAPGADCVFNGLFLGKDSQLVDHHTSVEHAKPRCSSHEFYHGVLADHSHGVFNGKIHVHPDAQKTDARQTNRNLLLSDDAIIDTKPQLEIFADDVKCTHGATVGQLDEEAVFYLRSRGIGLATARQMLIHAFVSDVVNRINVPLVRTRLERLLADRFRPAKESMEAAA
jgi:Fe-S cluster assembly protein SufD